MISAATIDAMIAAGASAEVIAAAWKAEIKAEAEAVEDRRAKDRDRQRRHRLSRDVTVTDADNALPGATPSQDKEIPHTPKEIKPIPSPPYRPPASQKRGSRLPDDFEPPEDWIAWAMAKRGWSRIEAIDECECFARHWQSKPGREATKLDWAKTWQNWAVNSRRKQGHDNPERITV